MHMSLRVLQRNLLVKPTTLAILAPQPAQRDVALGQFAMNLLHVRHLVGRDLRLFQKQQVLQICFGHIVWQRSCHLFPHRTVQYLGDDGVVRTLATGCNAPLADPHAAQPKNFSILAHTSLPTVDLRSNPYRCAFHIHYSTACKLGALHY